MAAGVYKICHCRDPVKCRHSWWFSLKRRGESRRFRASLDLLLEKHVDSKTVAEEEAGKLRAGILAVLDDPTSTALSPRVRKLLKGLPEPPQAPIAASLTVGQMLKAYADRHLASTATYEKQKYQIAAIGRTVLRRPDETSAPFSDWLIVDVTTSVITQLRELRRVQTIHKRAKGSNKSGGKTAANRDLQLLRAAFNWALDEEVVMKSPFKRGERTAVKLTREQARSRRLQPGEQERLLEHCGAHLRALVEAALESGCRRGELLSLQWRQVERSKPPMLHLPASKTKSGKARRVPISVRLQAVLEMRETALRTTLELKPDEPTPGDLYVFGNELGEAVASVKTAWGTAVEKAGITDLRFHDLRHEAGSRWLDSRRVTIVTIQKWLGHANVRQTSTYLQTTMAGEHEAMRLFDEHMGRLTPMDTDSSTPPHQPSSPATTTDEFAKETSTRH